MGRSSGQSFFTNTHLLSAAYVMTGVTMLVSRAVMFAEMPSHAVNAFGRADATTMPTPDATMKRAASSFPVPADRKLNFLWRRKATGIDDA